MKLSWVILILFYSTFTLAQTAYGLKGGLNYSGARTDNELIIDNQPKLGGQAGAFIKSLGVGWGFWAEALINAQGSKQQFGDESQKNTVGYLTFPLALQFTTPAKVHFYLGGFASFRLWARRKSSKAGVGDFEANIRDNIAFVDYGPWVGISYSYRQLLFDLRYLHGIPNFNTNSQINARAHTASGQLSVGYYLNRRNQR